MTPHMARTEAQLPPLRIMFGIGSSGIRARDIFEFLERKAMPREIQKCSMKFLVQCATSVLNDT